MLYDQLEEYNGKIVDLQIPLSIDTAEFGLVPAIIQFAATWLRKTSGGKILIPFSNLDNQLPDLMQQDYSYPIIILCWKRGIENPNDKTDLKPHIKQFNERINLRMRSLKDLRGNQLLLTCFDHLPIINGLLGCFYSDQSFISSEDILEFTLVPTLLHQMAFNKGVLRGDFKYNIDAIKGMIFELMKNTHEWGRTDSSNKPISPNIRGLYARFVRRPKATFVATYGDHPGFVDYFQKLPATDDEHLYFIELSIFDSGAGFIRRLPDGRHTQAIEEKLRLLKECLARNHTAAQGISSTGKGLGLDRILRILDKKGFLLIRTDELLVFRNMQTHPYIHAENAKDIALFDWMNNTKDEMTRRPYASGSAISIIYPLN